jgi:hypothetical protein
MADRPPGGSEAFKRWWLGPLGVLVGLLLVAATLVLVAQRVYDKADPDGFQSSLAKGVLLNGAVVAILGAVVATVLSIAAERRSRHEAAADTRLGLFRRMRHAHVRVALSQQILRARQGTDTYHEQMLVLQEVVKDMEEIRQEVKVSGRLYDYDDRRMIMEGIARLIIYLNKGVSEYVKWCNTTEPPKTPETRPDREESWVVVLVADHDGGRRLDPGDIDWESPGGMPPEYEDGLEQSKGMMRHVVYGASRKERAFLRQEVLEGIAKRERIAKRKAAQETGVPPSARAGPTPD